MRFPDAMKPSFTLSLGSSDFDFRDENPNWDIINIQVTHLL
jgi:hypothetical protein